ncbi:MULTISPECIES: hypothetical protein [Bacillus]|uniref:hypothetical protein n=1 Tax=Bacillus TaxID=1386 RepID=UPI001301715E|nr:MULTISPECIES: hypothetical protein [Bacillus]MBL3854164.1 hypothetical protein [Bacillus cereus]MCC0767932.1 hypothetical protein [Bacillus pacificus]MDA1660694.1 hypothetical protein [Bacillus cereus group sp. TH153LC]MDA1846102.1 hypothetical protein [Bacillus cereus]MDA1853043.1 hypothetical protein [Bacillus cereus]
MIVVVDIIAILILSVHLIWVIILMMFGIVRLEHLVGLLWSLDVHVQLVSRFKMVH